MSCIGADVPAVAMKVNDRALSSRRRRDPPAPQSLARALADCDLLELGAEVGGSEINHTTGKEDEMCLAVPQQSAKDENK
ncbi:MAG: hypothetical protein ACJ71Q_05830 [Terriglobales bacterium]